MDELKKYLKEHAKQLDRDEPDEILWQQIQERTVNTARPSVVMPVIRWAAAACIVLMAGVGSWHLLQNHTKNIQAGPAQPANPAVVQGPTEERDLRTAVIPDQPIQPTEETIHSVKQKTLPQTTNPAYSLVHTIEASFTQVINLQRNKLNSTPIYAESPAYFNDFKVEFKQMEKDEKQIKADIARSGLNDELVDQLINLYQQKLNTLKQLQTEMNKLNNRFKKERLPSDSTHTYFLNM